VGQDSGKRDFAAVQAGGHERRDWLGEIKWVYGSRVQRPFLNCVKELDVCSTAGTKRFHRHCATAALSQMLKQQTG
jgi:hypothetical protein